MAENGGVDWTQIIVTALGAALIAILSFFGYQLFEIRKEQGNIKECVAQNHGKVMEQFGRLEVTVKVHSAKLDAITATRLRGDTD